MIVVLVVDNRDRSSKRPMIAHQSCSRSRRLTMPPRMKHAPLAKIAYFQGRIWKAIAIVNRMPRVLSIVAAVFDLSLVKFISSKAVAPAAAHRVGRRKRAFLKPCTRLFFAKRV